MSKASPNQGAQLLSERTDISLSDISAVTGATRTSASRWRNSERIPDAEVRVKLRGAYSIPVEAWDRPVVAKAGGPKVPSLPVQDAPGATARPPSVPPSAPEPQIDYSQPGAARQAAMAQLQRLQAMMAQAEANPRTSTAERMKLNSMLQRAIREFGHFNGELSPADESKLCETPKWAQIKKVIVSSLLPFPEALKAVAQALEAM